MKRERESEAGEEFKMDSATVRPAIPTEIAIKLCDQIRRDNFRQWEGLAARWCWDCTRKAHGDPAQRGFSRRAGNRGCPMVNALYAQRYADVVH